MRVMAREQLVARLTKAREFLALSRDVAPNQVRGGEPHALPNSTCAAPTSGSPTVGPPSPIKLNSRLRPLWNRHRSPTAQGLPCQGSRARKQSSRSLVILYWRRQRRSSLINNQCDLQLVRLLTLTLAQYGVVLSFAM